MFCRKAFSNIWKIKLLCSLEYLANNKHLTSSEHLKIQDSTIFFYLKKKGIFFSALIFYLKKKVSLYRHFMCVYVYILYL